MAVTWITPAGSLGTIEERFTVSQEIVALSDRGIVQYSVIAGSLPRGLRLEGSYIVGSPTEVKTLTKNRFVIRATDGFDIKDRTFYYLVDGSDVPEWITKEGFLKVGKGDNYFVLDNAKVDFQLEVYDPDELVGDKLEYYLIPVGGEMPPGLTLTKDGKITGFTDPIFSVDIVNSGGYDTGAFDLSYFDKPEAQSNGFDTYQYDIQTFDYNEPSNSPRRLSRLYSFIVAVSDGINEVRRLFKIWVVTDEFLKADNSIIQVDNNIFRADNTSDRIPIWITESNLGTYRANNYLTIFLDVYDPPSLSGTISYLLVDTNPGTYKLRSTGEIIHDGRYELSGDLPSFTMTAKGNWDSNVNYFCGDLVIYNNTRYVCQIDNRNQTPSYNSIYWNTNISLTTNKFTVTNPGYWEVIIPETKSQLPPGMSLDSVTGEIAGKVPYQARVSEIYKFTMQAIDFPIALSNQSYLLQGDWNNNIFYLTNDAVRYDGFIYVALQQNKNQLPNVVDSIFWKKGVATAEKTFFLELIGEIDSAVNWISDSDLGDMKANQASLKKVEAESLLYGGRIVYELVSGKLPPGLALSGTGDITGKIKQLADSNGPGLTRFFEKLDTAQEDSVLGKDFELTFDNGTTTFDKIYKFEIKARDTANLAELTKQFQIRVVGDNNKVFANLYIKSFQEKSKRLEWFDFITNSEIFKPDEIYRYGDPNFGIQSEIKVLIYAGIETLEAVNYIQALSRNHYNKQLRFGDIKSAIAKDPVTQEILYETIYCEIIDEYQKNGKSISPMLELSDSINSPVLVSFDKIKVDSDIPFVSDRDHQRIFPNSIKNMRRRIKTLGERDRTFLPLWMRTIQDKTFVESGYLAAMIICYSKPGNSANIISRIKGKTNFASRGDWNSQSSYRVAESVKFAGEYYTAKGNNLNKNPYNFPEIWAKNFDFKSIDFTADRYVIDILDGEIGDKYLAFPQRGEKIP